LRSLDSLEAKPIPGTEGASCTPFFSPDGQWLGFYVQGYLKKVSLRGGTPVTLCSIGGLLGASWGEDGTIVFASTNFDGIGKVSAAGGKIQNITQVDLNKGEANHRYPFLLPGSKAMFFAIGLNGSGNESQIVLQRLDTGERRVVVQDGTYPRFVPTGHLVYVREGQMMAATFDLGRLEVTGPPVPIPETVRQSGFGAAQFALSDLGSLVYVPGVPGRTAGNTLVWVDRKGNFQPLQAPPRLYMFPKISPDGRQLAVTVRALKDDVWVYDIARDTITRLTFEGNNQAPQWTPNGKKILFVSNRAGSLNLFGKPSDGGSAEEQITKSEHFYLPGSISPDGKFTFYVENDPALGAGIWVSPLAGEPKPSAFLQTPANESAPTMSPDGHWLAYVSNESGRFEIYVRAFPGPTGKWQISKEGGTEPVWARNGRELFYRNGDKMMSVNVTTQPTFSAGIPQLLFEHRYERSPAPPANYDVAADGQHFLMVKEGEAGPPPSQINVVVNWFEELKEKVPVK
jgi:Tol biopolymer transport system component